MPDKKNISLDDTNYYRERTAPKGIRQEELANINSELNEARKLLKRSLKDRSVGYLSIPERRKQIKSARDMAKDVSGKFKTLLVLGVGGSDLGSRTLVRALKPLHSGMDVRFLGANTDPEEIAGVLKDIDLKKCAVNVVSKSGTTIEPMSTFMYLRERLVRKVGKKKHANHVIATTDKSEGTLREIAKREGYRTLPVPDDIGGRWSALTPVGLFPAACADISVNDLVRGAKKVRDRFLVAPAVRNDVLKFAGVHYTAYVKQGRNITVLMPYATRLDQFGMWFRQLWAESLGKKKDRGGRTVRVGLTPVAALGATDQHSQIQLYNEGPDDKLITFIDVEKMREDYIVPKPYPDLEGVAYFGKHSFSRILEAERWATAHALAENGKPNGTIHVSEINGENLGGLMMFFMLATSVMGELLDVDAYNQLGVEKGKKAISAVLGREGYEL